MADNPEQALPEAPLKKTNMRMRLGNVPSMYGIAQVRKFVANVLKMPQEAVVCRKAPKWNYAFLTFRPARGLPNVPELEALREKLSGVIWKKGKLDATIEEAKEDPMIAVKARAEPVEVKSLNDQVTPLWQMPYEEQLERKYNKILEVVKREGFTMEPIKASPVITGYRNKCEFTVGLDADLQPTVGFLLGGYREGIVTVGNARDTLHVPDVLKRLADHLETFVRSSNMAVFDRVSKDGYWRLLLARVHNDSVMAAVQISAKVEGSSLVQTQLVEHMKNFEFDGSNPIGSFFIQETQAVHHGIDQKASFRLCFGSETVTQTLCGLKFRISPLSFFQVNQSATEVLYATIQEYVLDSLSPDTILLDLCCGTGTIGMTLASQVKQVLGIELVKEAIEDAKINADINGIQNIKFHCDRVEAAIDKVIASLPVEQPIVVVLDPPRSGVHVSVIKAVRRCSRICRVVFVSCDPKAAAKNLEDLSRPETKGMVGKPFVMRRAVAVDLFPMTEHCELIVQFHREQ